MSAPDEIPVLVVGGGIGGLATALAMGRAGHPVHVIEQATEFVEIGAGLQIGANATRMMRHLGILEDAESVAVMPRFAVMRDAVTGEPLTRLTLGDAFRHHYGYPYLVMHRSDLLAILLDACRAHPLITLENNRRVTGVEQMDTLVTVTCADGTVYRTAMAVGADGLRSRMRRIIAVDEPVCSGYVAYRGTMPIDEVITDIEDNDVVLWIGPGIHLMQYPVRRGELYNQVAVFRSASFEEGEGEWGTPAEMDEMFAGATDAVRRSVESVSRLRRWPLFDREPLDRFVEGRVALLGDAAHPMLQVLGQGACQALEDAVCLAGCLTESPEDVPQALKRYEQARLGRTTYCQQVARPWAEVWHLDDPVAIALRNRVLRTRDEADYSDVDWLYAANPA